MTEYTVLSFGEMLSNFDSKKIEEAFKKFSCSKETDLENFLTVKAIPYEKTNFGKTYLFVDYEQLRVGEFSIIAYFTIATKAVDISSLPTKRKRKVLGDYPGRDGLNMISGYLIGQLGRNDAYTNNDLTGEQILEEAYYAISKAARVVGGKLIVLECRKHMFEKFYEKHGFKKIYDELNSDNLYMLYKKIDFSEYWNKKDFY